METAELYDILGDARQWLVGYIRHIEHDHKHELHKDVTWGAGFSVGHINKVIDRVDMARSALEISAEKK